MRVNFNSPDVIAPSIQFDLTIRYARSPIISLDTHSNDLLQGGTETLPRVSLSCVSIRSLELPAIIYYINKLRHDGRRDGQISWRTFTFFLPLLFVVVGCVSLSSLSL